MLYEVSYMSAAGIPSILHVNADGIERAQAYFCEIETGAEFCGIREGASSSRPGVPSVTVPADWQPREIETASEGGKMYALVKTAKTGKVYLSAEQPTDCNGYTCDVDGAARFADKGEAERAARLYGCEVVELPENNQVYKAETAAAPAEIGSDDKGGSAPAVKLANLIPLKSKITVYVPSTVNVNEAIDNSAQVERVARLLSECFGGATASPVSGYWVAADKSLVVEHTTMVFAFCDTASAEKYIDDVVRLCVSLKHEMGQEAIAMEYNGDMYFI